MWIHPALVFNISTVTLETNLTFIGFFNMFFPSDWNPTDLIRLEVPIFCFNLKSIYILSKFEHLKTNRSAARCSRKCYFSSLMWTRTLQILLILHDIDHVILIAMAFSTTVCWALTWPSPSSTTPNRPWKKMKNQRLLAGHPHDDHLTKNKKSQQTRTTKTTQYSETLGCPPPHDVRCF